MVCRRGGFIIQRHNELRDLEAEMLKMVCSDVQIEPVPQEINVASENGKALLFFMLGFVTRMQSLIEA